MLLFAFSEKIAREKGRTDPKVGPYVFDASSVSIVGVPDRDAQRIGWGNFIFPDTPL